MIKRAPVLLSTILILGLGFSYGASAQSAAPESTPAELPPAVTIVDFSGKIVNVDTAQSLVTLEGPQGGRVTFTVQNPDNLKAAKVGEPFSARYYDVLAIRKKNPGENIQDAATAGVWTTNPLGVPGGSRAVSATLVVTVEAIDETNGTVTVKAADGTTKTVKARNPENLKLLKAGDQLVVQLYRAIAISLQKESAAGSP
jgi:hypothetical protein